MCVRVCVCVYFCLSYPTSRSQWPRGLRRRSAATSLLGSWVRIPPGTWIFVCCECCMLSGRGLCDGLITRPEEFYRLWCVVVCNLETSMRSHTHSVVTELNKLRTVDADLRFYITTVQDGRRKSAFLTSACFPCKIH